MDPIAFMPMTPIGSLFTNQAAAAPQPAADSEGPSFAKTLEDAFDNLNSLQNKAGDMAVAYANHQTSDIHSVMMASEEASIALQMATQVRNKVVDAYQEIDRITL
jgi:flagellar hook-basal body complex protein FliE